MRGDLLLVVVATLSFTASCAHSPRMLAAAEDAVRVTDAPPMRVVEMPPLYVDARAVYARKIDSASTAATTLAERELSCPAVRVRRADMYRRADGTLWTVVRLNACGEERVYEETLAGWSDATARLR